MQNPGAPCPPVSSHLWVQVESRGHRGAPFACALVRGSAAHHLLADVCKQAFHMFCPVYQFRAGEYIQT